MKSRELAQAVRLGLARGVHQVDDVVADLLVDVDLLHDGAGLGDALRARDRVGAHASSPDVMRSMMARSSSREGYPTVIKSMNRSSWASGSA